MGYYPCTIFHSLALGSIRFSLYSILLYNFILKELLTSCTRQNKNFKVCSTKESAMGEAGEIFLISFNTHNPPTFLISLSKILLQINSRQPFLLILPRSSTFFPRLTSKKPGPREEISIVN